MLTESEQREAGLQEARIRTARLLLGRLEELEDPRNAMPVGVLAWARRQEEIRLVRKLLRDPAFEALFAFTAGRP